MDAATTLSRAGLTLELADGKIRAKPAGKLTDELRDLISTHKQELLALLSERHRLWQITEADGTDWTSSFCPPQALAEVQACYPGALSILPCPSATQPAGGALTGTERASVTAALDAMGEDDADTRREVLERCAADPEALAFWTARAPATWDDRRTCRECSNLAKAHCQAAARGELPATARKYRPPQDTSHRCKAFAVRGMPPTTSLPTNEVPPC